MPSLVFLSLQLICCPVSKSPSSSDFELHMTALALELSCTLMADRRPSSNVGLAVRNKVLPQALQSFFAALVYSANTSFEALLEPLLFSAKPSPQSGGVAKQALSSMNIVVFPSRAVAIENAFSPRLAIVDEHLTRHLPRKWLTSVAIERNCDSSGSTNVMGFSSSVASVLKDAELSVSEGDISSLIHMDVDRSFLPIPAAVKAAIFESFARQNMIESETDLTPSIRQFIKTSYGFPVESCSEFIYADSSLALFNKMVLCCIQEGGTLCFPGGSNGNYVSAAKFLKANMVSISTNLEEGFKLTNDVLSNVLMNVKNPWVYISGPTINPTGLLYSNTEIEKLLSTCAKFGARVVIDVSFSGLEFDFEGWGGWNLEGIMSKLNLSDGTSFSVSLLGGLSLKMLTGALQMGFLILNHPLLIESFYSFPGLSIPHRTMKYAIKKLLGLRVQKSGEMWDAVLEQTSTLRNRSKCLKEMLENCGWDVLESCGGVSMVAKPTSYLNKIVQIKNSDKVGEMTEEIQIDDSNIREALLKATGLCINSSSWTGIPGYCRFTIALEESEFQKALDCILKFKNMTCQ